MYLHIVHKVVQGYRTDYVGPIDVGPIDLGPIEVGLIGGRHMRPGMLSPGISAGGPYIAMVGNVHVI